MQTSILITVILSAGFGAIFGIGLTYFAWSLQSDSDFDISKINYP